MTKTMSTMAPAVQEPAQHARPAEKDRFADAQSSGFTAVNGRRSQDAERTNGMLDDRPLARRRQSPDIERPDDRRHVSRHPDPRPPANYDRMADPASSSAHRQDSDIPSPPKRKRSSSKEEEDDRLVMVSPRQSTTTTLGKRVYVESDSSDSDDGNVERPQFHGHKMPDSRSYHASDADPVWMDRQRKSSNGDARDPEARHRDPSRQEDRLSRASGDVHSADAAQDSRDYGGTASYTKAGVKMDPAKRKRIFSNRTKTGCQTCRRRKKKCDEGRPECNNCSKGGFVCEGYLTPVVHQKSSLKSHIPLQSKDGYPEHSGMYSRFPRDTFVEQTPQPMESGHSANRPIAVDEEPHRATQRRNPWATGWPEQPPRSYTQDRVNSNSDYSRPAPMPDSMGRRPSGYKDSGLYNSASGTRPHPQSSFGQPSQLSNSQPATMAHLALQHQPFRASQPQAPLTEKEKMISGMPYLPFTPQLIDEREQCKISLSRFNSALAMGVSREERARLFRLILEPPHLKRQAPPIQPVGSLGQDVQVEAPFTCDYGYNIIIGDEVVIGANCTIIDPVRVSIGPRCVIGPNVSIYAGTVSSNPKHRKGSKGTAYGVEIHIEEDVFIGGSAIIMPGVRVKKGSTIAAGSVVEQDKEVPQHIVTTIKAVETHKGAWDEI